MMPVYILTETGKSYTDEGLEYIEKRIAKKHPENDGCIYFMGSDYNDRFELAQRLRADNKNNIFPYIFISTEDDLLSIYCENGITNHIAELLECDELEDCTSWESMLEIYDMLSDAVNDKEAI